MNLEFTPLSNVALREVVLKETLGEEFTIPYSIKKPSEDVWSKLTLKQPKLHASPLYRVTKLVNSEQSLCEVATDITYKDIVGIRNTPNFKDYFKDTASIPHALSMIALVYTKDEKLLLLERSTGDWEESLELPGAFMRPAWGSSLYKQALTFLHNDLLITEEDIDSHSIIGSLHYSDICEHMLITRFNLKCTYEELISAKKRVVFLPENYSRSTHTNYFTLPLHSPSATVLSLNDQF